jgi:outer membrane murein-binding lipoprotein Lpp
MNTLYLESVELASEVRTLLPRLTQKDQDLARRMKRSADELTLHLEESMLATGRLRRFELRAAEAAMTELAGCVSAAKGVGYLEPRPLRLEARIAALRERLGSSERGNSEHKRAQTG